MPFQPDYRHFAALMRNERPARLPFYEHVFSPAIMETVLEREFMGLSGGDAADQVEFFRLYNQFFAQMGYDTVIWEVCVGGILPGNSALCGGRGPIQSRADFQAYPWGELAERFWRVATPSYDAFVASIPAGMKAVGGVGNGVFEIAETLVGLEHLPYMQVDDPELYTELFARIGSLLTGLWAEFLPRYGQYYVAGRMGDDLGHKRSLLTNPRTVRDHILPQYKRIIDTIHGAGLPFLWHSCGCIFEVMDDVIALGIDAKHSNEDTIAPFQAWIDRYSDRIALLGGFDLDFLCTQSPDVIYDTVLDQGRRYRVSARGWALGSGNSIPDYVPVDSYLAMIRAGQALRAEEAP
ncbi:MAG: hypothetical protein HZB16_06925 [Armatimonadetes bacterium]|nr:hypothetical protein [Armatimonadota bacterium]